MAIVIRLRGEKPPRENSTPEGKGVRIVPFSGGAMVVNVERGAGK